MIAFQLFLAAASLVSAAFTTQTSTQSLYVQVLEAMSNLPQPQYVTYSMESAADGLQADLVTAGEQVWLNVHGGSGSQTWTLRHRTADYTTEIVDGGRRYVTARSFFDPTWYGAYRALHEGMFDSQDPAAPRVAAPAPAALTSLKTIAVTSVMGPGIYAIEDRGDATCASGDPGRALHLISRERNSQHQLTDVIVDLRSMRFCMMRFAQTSAFGFHGYLEQHYADVGGYWMQTDGLMDGTIRAFGISLHHGIWRYRLLNMQFPQTLPAAAFAARIPAAPAALGLHVHPCVRGNANVPALCGTYGVYEAVLPLPLPAADPRAMP